jgi:hypothetical protein
MNPSTTGNNGPSQGMSPANDPNAGPPSNAVGTGRPGTTISPGTTTSPTGR